MKIKRFNETLEVDISNERIDEIIEDLEDTLFTLEDKSKKVDLYLNELNNYKNKSKKGNDQIDDSIFAFQIVKKNLNDSMDKLDTIIKNLNSYNEEGRKYLYTEI